MNYCLQVLSNLAMGESADPHVEATQSPNGKAKPERQKASARMPIKLEAVPETKPVNGNHDMERKEKTSQNQQSGTTYLSYCRLCKILSESLCLALRI